MMDVIEEELRLIELFREKAADRRRELVMIANDRFDDERRHRKRCGQPTFRHAA